MHEPTIKPTKKPVSIAPQNVSPTSRPVSAPTLLPFDSAVFPTVEPTSLAPQLISHTDDHHLELSCNLPSGTIGYLSTVMCPPEAYEAYKICHSFSGLCKFNYCCSYTPTSSPTLNPSINPTLNPLTNPTLNPANKKFNSTSSSNSSSNTVNASIGMYAGIGAAVVVIGAIALFVFFRFYASSNDKNTHFTAPGGHMTPAYATAESAYVKDTYKTIADPIRVSENPMRASPQKPRRNLEATSSTTTNSTLPITMESMNVKRTVTPVVPSAKPILKPTIEVVQQDSSPSTQPVNDSSDVNRSTTNPVVPSPKAISKPTETTIVIQQESTALGTYSTAAAAVATSKIDLGKTTTMATTAGSTTATTSSTTIPLTSLSEQQVISVMTVLGLSSYIDQFVDAALPGSLLSNIETVEDLTDCGISLPGPMAKLLLKFISRANENGVEQKYLK